MRNSCGDKGGRAGSAGAEVFAGAAGSGSRSGLGTGPDSELGGSHSALRTGSA